MAKRGMLGRRSRQLYSNKYLFPYPRRTFPIMRYENELSTVCPSKGVKHKPLALTYFLKEVSKIGRQQGKQAVWNNRVKDDAYQYMQYLRYLYPFVRGEILKEKGRVQSTFESRLDVVTYHLDWSRTKSSSRQDVSHGHILVNGTKVTVAGYKLKVGDVMECIKSPSFRKNHRVGFIKPHYSSCEVNHRIRAAVFLNPQLPCKTSVCNVKRGGSRFL